MTITTSGGPLSANPTATPATICTGTNVELNAIVSGGSGLYTYTWTSIPVGFTSSIANPIVNPFVNTIYGVEVSDGMNTVNAQVMVTVNALPETPSITSNGPTAFCTGDSVTLTSSAGISYLWSTGETTASIHVSRGGSYTVQVTDTGGCLSATSATALVTVNSFPLTPTITAVGPTAFCAGDSVTLTSSAGTSYLWSTGETTANIHVTTGGSYTVQITSADGCQSAASVATLVTVNALPGIPTITAGGSTNFCEGGSVTLTSDADKACLWSTGETGSSIYVTTAGSYTVQVTDANGCQSAPSVATMITVNALPETPFITAGGPTTICAGDSVILTSSAGSTYYWSTGETGSSINVTAAGSYKVVVNDANGCQSAASPATVVNVNALPIVNITSSSSALCTSDVRTLTGSPSGGTFIVIDGRVTLPEIYLL